MKMFVFYFTAFFIDPIEGFPIPVTNTFVYNTLEECRVAEWLIIQKNEAKNCKENYHHHTSNDPVLVESAILRKMAKEFNDRNPIKN